MKTRTIIIFAFATVVVGLIISFPYLLERALKAGSGPIRRFELPERPPFLTEDLALEKARETLRLDGFDISGWQPHPSGRTKAPDRRADEFMDRNDLNANLGVFMFTDGTNARVRIVSVELHSNTVVCQSSVGR